MQWPRSQENSCPTKDIQGSLPFWLCPWPRPKPPQPILRQPASSRTGSLGPSHKSDQQRAETLFPCSHLNYAKQQRVFWSQERSCFIVGGWRLVSTFPTCNPRGTEAKTMGQRSIQSSTLGPLPPLHQPRTALGTQAASHPTQARWAQQRTRAPSRANTAAGPVFSSGSMRRRQRRRRKASVLRYSRWNFQPKSEAYSQPSPSASACRCCEGRRGQTQRPLAGLQGALGLAPATPFSTHPITGTLQMGKPGRAA